MTAIARESPPSMCCKNKMARRAKCDLFFPRLGSLRRRRGRFGPAMSTAVRSLVASGKGLDDVATVVFVGGGPRTVGLLERFAASADDRLHEPYRAAHAPHLEAIRSNPPRGFLGATLSGSGPTVIVWAEKDRAGETAAELSDRFPDHEVLHLPVTTTGASAV